VTILCDSRHDGLRFVEKRGRGRRKDLKGGGRLESTAGGDFQLRKAQQSVRAAGLQRRRVRSDRQTKDRGGCI
jgi:hypothetical protein